MHLRNGQNVLVVLSLAQILGGCDAISGGSGTEETEGFDPRTGEGDPLDPETLAAAAEDPTICVPGVPGTSQLPRLSRLQYDNTVRDLFGIDLHPSTMLAPDSEGSVDQRAWDGYQLAAATVAREVMADEFARSQALSCVPEGDGAACAQSMIAELGRRVFRRPLTSEEVARFGVLIERRAELTPTGSFDELAQLIIEAFLLSPSFVTRAEIAEQPQGEYFALNGYEVASRLSYMLWDSMPDEPLLAAAESGDLAGAEGILAQAARMLGDPKAHGMVEEFHKHYLHMGPGTRWEDVLRDATIYPAFADGLAPILAEETTRFVEHVVFEQVGSFQDLIMDPVGFVNSDLAPLYGLDSAAYGAELVRVDLDPSERAGIFTRLGFLASHSYYDRSSPIHRGAFLQKDVLCAPIGTPPPGAEGEPLPTEGLETNRSRVDAQTSAPACAACHHSFINPTGFAFEAYDAVGAIQTTESFSGASIDTRAQVTLDEDTIVSVDGPVELSQAIADSPAAHTCYARKWVEYAYNRALNNEDSCVVNDLSSRLTEGGYTIIDLVVDLTQSESFRYRVLEPEAAQ